MPPKKREAFIGLEKIALRCRKKENPLATQKEAIDMLLNDVDEIVEDSEHDLEQSIIDSFSPPEVQESDDEGVEVLEQITADQALIMLQRLRLYEEQSDDGNKKLMDQLYRHERVVEARRVKGLHQRTLTSFYKL